MNETIDHVTYGHLQLTPKAATILADLIRKAVADRRSGTEPSDVECHLARRS